MSQRNETRYSNAMRDMRNGADDETIRLTYGFPPQVITALRKTLTDKGPQF